MKTLQNVAGFALLFAILYFAGCVKESATPTNQSTKTNSKDYQPSNGTYLDSVLVDPWQSGNSAFECDQAGDCHDFSLKLDPWDSDMDGDYSDPNAQSGTAAANIITVSNSDGHTFSWSSEYQMCAVIVKAGSAANVYYYPEGTCSGSGLLGPVNNSGTNAAISHVTFCWRDATCDQEEEEETCYSDETAWAAGERYAKRGNWATYTAYPGDGQSVNIYAGKTNLAGTVTFNDNNDGTVDLVIQLSNDFIFYYDLLSQTANENIKVQDYKTAPKGNPAPGKFEYKGTANIGANSYTITVPKNNYYGIHLDVAEEVECDD